MTTNFTAIAPGIRNLGAAMAQAQLKPSLLVELRDFDASAEHSDTRWDDSAKATDGLTSDEVHKKGSLAVQAMLRWLEVARLARRSAKKAAEAPAAEQGSVQAAEAPPIPAPAQTADDSV